MNNFNKKVLDRKTKGHRGGAVTYDSDYLRGYKQGFLEGVEEARQVFIEEINVIIKEIENLFSDSTEDDYLINSDEWFKFTEELKTRLGTRRIKDSSVRPKSGDFVRKGGGK